MKQQYFIIQVLLIILWGGFVSCSESDTYVDSLKSVSFDVSPLRITLKSGEDCGEFDVKTNCDWHARSEYSWIQIKNTDGKGRKRVEFMVDYNYETPRYGYIKVYINKPIYSEYLIQMAQETTSLAEMTTTSYKSDGGSLSLNVTAGSSQSWVVKRDYSDTWVHLGNRNDASPTYSGSGTKSVSIYVDKNTGSSRSATLAVTCGSTSKTITITQDAPFNASMPTTNYKADGDYWRLYVTAGSSQSWTIRRNYSDSWVHLGSSYSTSSTYSGSGTESVWIYVDKNTGGSRSATLTVTCGSTTKTITITQEPPFRITSVETANIDYNGSIINDYGTTIHSYQTRYLSPKLYITDCTAGTYTIYTKLYTPSGTLSQGSSSPSGYTFKNDITIYSYTTSYRLSGWGSATAGRWGQGSYKWEFYLDGVKIGEQPFYIYN